MRLSMVPVVLVALAGCAPAEEPDDAKHAEPPGRLVLTGDAVERGGTYEVSLGCQYSRSHGLFQLSAHGDTARPGLLTLTVGPSRVGLPGIRLEDGTYGGTFSFDEPRDDGRVLLHHGEIDVTIRIVDRDDVFPVVEVTARGVGQDMEIEISGRCPTMVTG